MFLKDMVQILLKEYVRNSRQMEVKGALETLRLRSFLKKDIKNLLEGGTPKVILKEEVPPDANLLLGRFMLATKSYIDRKIT